MGLSELKQLNLKFPPIKTFHFILLRLTKNFTGSSRQRLYFIRDSKVLVKDFYTNHKGTNFGGKKFEHKFRELETKLSEFAC